jgi:hypothetical protein
MENMKEEFRKWMKEQGYKDGTSSSYISGITTISNHYFEETNDKIDLFSIKDKNIINRLDEKYGINGEYQKVGEKGNGTVRNAIAAYAKFLEQEDFSNNLPTNTEDKLEVISRAFKLILPVLARYIGEILLEKDKNNWWQKYVLGKLKNENTIRNLPREGSDNDRIQSLDIPACLNIIECNWLDVFRNKMDDRQRTWAHALSDIRNYYEAHYTTKTLTKSSVEDISLELAIMIRFMRPIDADVTDRISEMRKVFENKFNDKKPETEQSKSKNKGKSSKDKTTYEFKGKTYNKRQLVLAVINSYVRDHPDVTLESLQNIFDKCRYVVDLYANAWDNTDRKRHFFDKAIELNNRQTIVVYNQWGSGNIDDFINKATELGYDIVKNAN